MYKQCITQFIYKEHFLFSGYFIVFKPYTINTIDVWKPNRSLDRGLQHLTLTLTLKIGVSDIYCIEKSIFKMLNSIGKTSFAAKNNLKCNLGIMEFEIINDLNQLLSDLSNTLIGMAINNYLPQSKTRPRYSYQYSYEN